MKNNKRSAFTIVELVIVIAVIAILSAVLIPTFGAIIKDANVAADQTAASTLTSELHIHLKGNTIDSEEELMTALEESGVGEKLVPKALAYGYHFWFDMENQMFVAKTAEEIQADRAPYEGSAASGMRNIYNNGYYLADAESVIANMFGNMADITAATYASYFANVKAAVDGDNYYNAIAEKVYENLKKTIIVNDNGIFFYNENTRALTENSVWFAPGLEVVTANYYEYNGTEVKAATALPGVVHGEFTLPSSVLLVEPNALNFADVSTKIALNTIVGENYAKITNIFAPKSTNANIVDKDGKIFNITVADGTTHKDGETVIEQGTDILVENGVFVAYLVPKAPFDEWEIGYDLTDDSQVANEESWLYYSNSDAKLYLNIASATEFFIQDAAGNKSDSVKEWKSSNPAVIDSELNILGHGETTITAVVVNRYGEETEQSVDVVVNAAKTANIKVNAMMFNLSDGNNFDINWQISDTSSQLVPAKNGNITYYYNYAKGSDDITVTLADENGSLKKVSGNTLAQNGDKVSDAIFTVTVDGCLETTFKTTLVDNTKSPYQVNFYDKSNGDTYLYYIGDNNAVTLGALFDAKAGAGTLAGATLTVYDQMGLGGYNYPANNTAGSGLTVTLNGRKDYDDQGKNYTAWVLDENWETAALQFTMDADFDAEDVVYIKVTPAGANAQPLFVRVHIVDATNVEFITDDTTTVNKVNTELDNGNVVLFDSFTMVTGQTLNVGSKTLYGNGYVISAEKYTAAPSGLTYSYSWCTQCNSTPKSSCSRRHSDKVTTLYKDYFKADEALISMDDGTIDNIYINGPVYPELQYLASEHSADGVDYVLTGYYVSGIIMNGKSTVINSYVSGFRQPIKSNSDEHVVEGSTTVYGNKIVNTTLRGGNFGNLLLADGDLYLKNVTTIQDQNGMKDTINTSNNVYVTGVGIAIDKSALGSQIDIVIEGYLDQYNWIKKGSTAQKPIISSSSTTIDTNTVFDWIFNGAQVNLVLTKVVADVGNSKYFINQDTTQDSSSRTDGYVNAGILFAEIGSEADIGALNVNVVIHDANRKDGALKARKFETLDMRFVEEGATIPESIPLVGGKKITGKDILGTDGRFIVWSYKDGRNWKVDGFEIGSPITRYCSPTGTLIENYPTQYKLSNSLENVDDSGYAIIYRGYYGSYGNYSDLYVVNDANKIAAPVTQ